MNNSEKEMLEKKFNKLLTDEALLLLVEPYPPIGLNALELNMSF